MENYANRNWDEINNKKVNNLGDEIMNNKISLRKTKKKKYNIRIYNKNKLSEFDIDIKNLNLNGGFIEKFLNSNDKVNYIINYLNNNCNNVNQNLDETKYILVQLNNFIEQLDIENPSSSIELEKYINENVINNLFCYLYNYKNEKIIIYNILLILQNITSLSSYICQFISSENNLKFLFNLLTNYEHYLILNKTLDIFRNLLLEKKLFSYILKTVNISTYIINAINNLKDFPTYLIKSCFCLLQCIINEITFNYIENDLILILPILSQYSSTNVDIEISLYALICLRLIILNLDEKNYSSEDFEDLHIIYELEKHLEYNINEDLEIRKEIIKNVFEICGGLCYLDDIYIDKIFLKTDTIEKIQILLNQMINNSNLFDSEIIMELNTLLFNIMIDYNNKKEILNNYDVIDYLLEIYNNQNLNKDTIKSFIDLFEEIVNNSDSSIVLSLINKNFCEKVILFELKKTNSSKIEEEIIEKIFKIIVVLFENLKIENSKKHFLKIYFEKIELSQIINNYASKIMNNKNINLLAGQIYDLYLK